MRTMRCDECGKETTSNTAGWLHVGWWGLTPKGETFSRDFCSEVCLASFYTRRTQERVTAEVPRHA